MDQGGTDDVTDPSKLETDWASDIDTSVLTEEMGITYPTCLGQLQNIRIVNFESGDRLRLLRFQSGHQKSFYKHWLKDGRWTAHGGRPAHISLIEERRALGELSHIVESILEERKQIDGEVTDLIHNLPFHQRQACKRILIPAVDKKFWKRAALRLTEAKH